MMGKRQKYGSNINIVRFGAILFLINSILFSSKIVAQHQPIPLKYLHFQNYSEKDGANVQPIYYRDKKDFMWIFFNTIQRFDGHHFKSYFKKEDGYIFGAMVEDKLHNLFVLTWYHGIKKYSEKNDNFLDFQDSIIVNGKKRLLSGGIAVTSNGDIWIAGSDYIARLKNGGKAFEDITPLLGLPYTPYPDGIFFDDQNHWWFSTSDLGVIRIHTSTLEVTTSYHNPKNEPIFDQCIGTAHIIKDKDHNLWIKQFVHPHPQRWIKRYNMDSNQWHTYTFPYKSTIKLEFGATWIHNYFVDNHGVLWVRLGENVGIARYKKAEDRFEILYTEKQKPHGLEGGFVYGSPSSPLVYDRLGNFVTSSVDILPFNPYRQYMYQISNDEVMRSLFGDQKDNFETLETSHIRNLIQAADSNIYVSYIGLGIVKLDRYFQNPKHLWFVNNAATYTSCIFTVDGRTLFFGDSDYHIYSFDIGSQKVKKVVDGTVFGRYIRSYFVENDTTIWLGHIEDGISKFNPKTNAIKKYDVQFIPTSSPTQANVYDIVPHGEDYLWLATYMKGLQLFDKRSGKIVKQWSHQGTNVSHVDASYYNLHQHTKDTMLLASNDGLIILNTQSMKWSKIDVSDGMRDNICFDILPSPQNMVVAISTQSEGLCFANIKTKQVTYPSKDQGNTIKYYRSGGITTLAGEMIFVSAHQGLTVVQPFENKEQPMNLKLTELIINEKNYPLTYTSNEPLSINLKEEANKVEIKFSIMDLWHSSATEYYIFLKGGNDKWEKVLKPTITYQYLKSGNYERKIKAINTSTGQSKIIRALIMKVYPPWYKSVWFVGFSFIAISTGLYAFFSYRYQQKKKLNDSKMSISNLNAQNFQKQLEIEQFQKQLNEVKLEVLRAQMNPHFIFNSLNSIDNFILKNDKRSASEYLHTFSKLIRNTLDSSRNELVPFTKDFETIKWYVALEQMRFRHIFAFETKIDEHILNNNTMVPPMLVQPFIENAIIHGLIPCERTDLTLGFEANIRGNAIHYTITDNGIGRKASQSYKSLNMRKSEGISITTQRLKIHNGSLYQPSDMSIHDLVEGGTANGTRVEIKIYIK
ncbi:MAG: histidine kinase [Saprospiraceae bacterium]|nr:histidine kinase [Saprospiraceae bacterium]